MLPAPYFVDYTKQYTNLPFLVVLDEQDDGEYLSGRFLRASDIGDFAGEENAEWKMPMFDAAGKLRLPGGSVGFRWENEKQGRWNRKNEDVTTGEAFDPLLTCLDGDHDAVQVKFADFTDTFNTELGTTPGKGQLAIGTSRGVPCRTVTTADGKTVRVTTAYDLMLAQFGIDRSLGGDFQPPYAA